MEYKLTLKAQHSKKCVDGKQRNFLLFFLNNVLILKQKIPYDESCEKGFDVKTSINNIYLLNNKLYQERISDTTKKKRIVKFPISKKKLEQFNIPKDLKIEINN
mgnify:CR=1 FL=1